MVIYESSQCDYSFLLEKTPWRKFAVDVETSFYINKGVNVHPNIIGKYQMRRDAFILHMHGRNSETGKWKNILIVKGAGVSGSWL